MGVGTFHEPVVYMRPDCFVCRSEGLALQPRVRITGNGQSFTAKLNHIQGDLLNHGEAGLSEIAWVMLGADEPCEIVVSHSSPRESFGHVRAKLFGHTLLRSELDAIVRDIADSQYSDVELSAFLAGCVGERMDLEEIVSLTQAMVAAGQTLDWGLPTVVDKHCVGGLPGNRTTPIVVAIVAACGLIMPKTSSRAITSPAGTADTMETMTRVDLSLTEIRTVVEQNGGCLVWGGAVALSPADDVLIRVERALDVDSEAQLVASVLSKKIAAGSTHTLIDIPTGPTAKLRDQVSANVLSQVLCEVGDRLGLNVATSISDGSQPVGRGVGPALEARDVLSVLQGKSDAPHDLKNRAIQLAGRILEQGGRAKAGAGIALAQLTLDGGEAWRKFQAICESQGGLVDPPEAAYRYELVADQAGEVASFDNRRLARVAKLAGAPQAPAAGLEIHVRLGDEVDAGSPLLTLHAQAQGELDYALDYLRSNADLIEILDHSQEKVG